jgi:hypothetical protein
MYIVTPNSGRRADSLFIFLADGSRFRIRGPFPTQLGDHTFKQNEAKIRALGWSVQKVESAEVAAPEPVVVAAVSAPEAPVVDSVEPAESVSVEESTPEDVVVDSTSDEPVSSDASPEEEKVTRKRRSKSAE